MFYWSSSFRSCALITNCPLTFCWFRLSFSHYLPFTNDFFYISSCMLSLLLLFIIIPLLNKYELCSPFIYLWSRNHGILLTLLTPLRIRSQHNKSIWKQTWLLLWCFSLLPWRCIWDTWCCLAHRPFLPAALADSWTMAVDSRTVYSCRGRS